MRLFADDRESLDTAYAGDVVGLANPGAFAIGDTLYEGTPCAFRRFPSFAPEHFASVRSIDVRVTNRSAKGIAQLREEGAVQVFYPWGTPRTEPILGAVGELQFEVAKYRLESEYNVETRFDAPAVRARAARRRRARAISPARICRRTLSSSRIGTAGRSALFESEWSVRLAQEWNPALRFVPSPRRPAQEAVAS